MISLPSCFNLEAVAPMLTALIEVDAFLPEKRSQEHYARHPREYYSVDQHLGRRHRRLSSSEAMTASYSRAAGGWHAEFLTIRRECNHSQSSVGAEGRTMILANKA